MRKLYNEFFYIPKYGKIREKVMLTRIVSTIAIVIMCLAAMSITAYAYFSCNVASSFNTIKAASFETEVGVQIESARGETVEVRTSNHITHAATLTGGKTYFVTLQHADQSTAQTGFVIITATNCDGRYHTQQIGRNEDGTTKVVTFELKTTADAVVTFYSHWGTSSCYPEFKGIKDVNDQYIHTGESVVMIVNEETPPPEHSQTENIPSGESITPAATETEPPATDAATQPTTVTTPPETTEASEPTDATEPAETDTTETGATEEPTNAAHTPTAP